MLEQQYPHISVKLQHRKYLEIGAIVVLLLFTMVLYAIPKFETEELESVAYVAPIENIEIPPETQQFDKPPPPARPSIPIESEDDEIDEDFTIEETDLEDFEILDEPPPPPESNVIFIAYDEPPEPMGGYAAIQKAVVYPEIAREAGIEGTVIVQATIGKDGRVKETIILKGIPKTGLDEAAMDAIKTIKWKPAYQRDKPVTVRISVPVVFRLKNG
ncbi:MAG: energy transducer TonB [Candidatus Marinimicrobia bacterium]|jgi:protein TonB|nr:energy transducer TonB [Candidatus Neomarinimicrobiota bacterium]MBT3632387.1 energy transducer TonB [Candidatus Neomarinimicrobiota bacterium]MBT3825835.1 energy transducer TonB [Candidatus Neomarinimicrobiota bacterium]MBT4129921.1 energy transducer TonB [Candidatus Neomarinimicrobiota bacterium]MBT4294216.1 energy transducer TonB [Candidatus Neomarinimicrobiota bacterium]